MHLYVPQYEGLNIEKVLGFIKNHVEIYQFLPDISEVKKCPK